MLLNRRLFLIGSTAALAVAAAPKLIIPGQAATAPVSHLALPDGAVERAIVYLYASPRIGGRAGVMRLGHLGAPRPHVMKAFSGQDGPDWYPAPGQHLILTPRNPIAVLDWEGVPPGGAVIVLELIDKLADGSEQRWLQERSFEWGMGKADVGELEEGFGADTPLMSDFGPQHLEAEQAEVRSRAWTPVADRVARYRRGDFS